jgi:acetyl esterase/lipase
MRGAQPGDASAFPATRADVLRHFLPTLVIVGTRDFAMSSAINLQSKLVAAGVDARLHMWEGGRILLRHPRAGSARSIQRYQPVLCL